MRVLVGYDGSDFAMQALEWALDEAELRKLPLTVVHAWAWPYGEAGEEAKRHLREAAEHVLWHGADCARATSSVTDIDTDLYEGDAAERLVELSAGAELVVVGSRGLSRLSMAVVGSVAAHVAAHARCPVIVVRGPGPLPAPPHRGPVVALASGRPWDAVLDFALREAALRQLPLLAAHMAGQDTAGEAELRRAVTLGQDRFPEVRAEVEAHPGEPREAVETLSRRASLLVVGDRPVTRAALEHAACPVAVVRTLQVFRSYPNGTF